MANKRVKEIKQDDYVYIGDLIKSGKAWMPGYKDLAFGEDEVNDSFIVYADNMWLLVEEVEPWGDENIYVGCEEYEFVANKDEVVEYTTDL